MAKPLAERIASAKSTVRIRIADLESLIEEAKAEQARLMATAEQQDAESIDFALSDEIREEASRLASHYQRTARGLANEIEILEQKLNEAVNSEKRRAADAERAAAIAERDDLAARLKSEWPALEYSIVELLTAIQSNEARLQSAAPGEPNAEAVARDLPANFYRNGVTLRRLKETKLPSFAEANHLAWPIAKRLDLAFAHNTDAKLAMRRERDAENARWSRYMVQAPADGKRTMIETRKGMAPMYLNVIEAVMTVEAVKDAEANGCKVTPLKDNETVGLPSDRVTV